VNEQASRDDLINDGDLIDYTDLAGEMGWGWPVAITHDLELAIQATMPEGLGLAGADNTMGQVLNEQALSAAMFDILSKSAEVLQNVVRNDPAAANARQVIYQHEAAWKPGTTLAVAIRIELDDSGLPCFTLDSHEPI
jgi:hypothetical protein